MKTLGAYVHIPFCIQRCHYCDFATYARDQIAPNQDYVDKVCLEIQRRKDLFEKTNLASIYFGGGTPSLLASEQIGQIINEYRNVGFEIDDKTEITLEVNPATLTDEKCIGYKKAGVNRVSIGCQSFNDPFLKACNREHNADQTRQTIALSKRYFSNFSLDLLYSLPHQHFNHVKDDVLEMLSFDPPHISAYCLTLPAKHPMNDGRCADDEQVEMFELIANELEKKGLNRYELSNFSHPGRESIHNNLYWTDKDYWGVGLSAHSYKSNPEWGQRFWNPSNYQTYIDQIDQLKSSNQIEFSFPQRQFETLKLNESLTDFCHTHLRLESGLNLLSLRQKYGEKLTEQVQIRLKQIESNGWAEISGQRTKLTSLGFLLSNKVFEHLLFSASDIDKDQSSPLF